MSAHGDPSSNRNEDVTFETTDVATKPVVLSVLSLAVFTVIFTIVGHYVFFGFAAREEASSPPANPLASEHAVKEPPAPRLQVDAVGDLKAFRAEQAAIIGRLAWVDESAGVVQVPIERAMELLLAKGLPARSGPVPVRMTPPTGVAPTQHPEGSGAPDWFAASSHGSGDAAHGEASHDAHGKAEEAHGH